ncbi:hypothetical protein ABKW28_19215 [Nocardioides sp. 31GB23]|uniref:hypothetical protein n=1 Tax=Nocardioides sp. 31GB23 TaxID=3156065 RepID=UPI0032AEF28E
MIWRLLCHLKRDPRASAEALRERSHAQALGPKVERVVRERARLHAENNYTARIRALYQEGRTS